MSSRPYSADLAADLLLRRMVIASGLAFTLLGILVIVGLAMPAFWKGLGSSAWVVAGVARVTRLARGYRQYSGIRVHAHGGIELLCGDRAAVDARLLPGSIVLPGYAWLRIGLEDGGTCAELLRCNMGENEAWRRLQVIWRHLGGGR